tara:strand:+ start:302 stop:679 length:378 start_codon:yes stop_codon:yes gene_type:complete
MTTIMISILPEGMAVDTMDEDESGNTCPLPTQDDELNAANREIAVEEYNYREPNTGSAFRITEACGSCGMYNQSEDIMDCIGDESGSTGYCQLLKFVCSEDHSCDEWVEGGPITSDKQEEYKDIL